MYLQETDFDLYFCYLKALGLDDYFGWDDHTAQKEHIDIYGVKIEKGEKYFDITIKRKIVKFSRQSMDEYLYLLFKGTPRLQEWGQKLLDDKEEKSKEAIEKLH